jgi:hypothetical protein
LKFFAFADVRLGICCNPFNQVALDFRRRVWLPLRSVEPQTDLFSHLLDPQFATQYYPSQTNL